MPRHKRPYLPGGVFHLSTRVHGRLHILDDPSKDMIMEMTADALRRSDIRMAAFVIMTNHLHFVLRQGDAPLGAFMQPLLRRISSYCHKTHQLENQVFGDRFHDECCRSPEYFRTLITYAHANPCRALVCPSPDAYHWSSHKAYLGIEGPASLWGALIPELDLFRSTSNGSIESTRQNYEKFLAFRIARDVARRSGLNTGDLAEPEAGAGNLYWRSEYAQFLRVSQTQQKYKPDLRDLMQQRAAELAPGETLDHMRGRHIPPALVAVRASLIREAVGAGHGCVVVARFFGISEGRVSQIAGAGRARMLPTGIKD
jgi:REP element-mobilizing transposase RayT